MTTRSTTSRRGTPSAAIHERRRRGLAPDTVWLLEHPPVFTAGKRTSPGDRPPDPGGAPVIDVDRGGMITFHGPGQLVGYPIVRLPDHVKVVDYVRRVEEALIGVCRDLGLATARVPGRSGVWLRADSLRPERKIAALGIRVSRGRDHARLRPQLRRRPLVVRPVRPVRHRRRRRDVAVRRARPRRHGVRRAPERAASPHRAPGMGGVRRRRPTTSPAPSRVGLASGSSWSAP